jgi:hypothetical protein
VWTPGGQFARVFGREGSGPGELARGAKYIGFGPGGNLHIADNNRRWSIFSPAFDFIRNLPATATGTGLSNAGFFTSDGLFVGSGGNVARTGNSFAVFDFSQTQTDGSPRLVRAFGTSAARRARPVAPSIGTNFWAGPPESGEDGYVFELWRTDGTLLRTIRRDVPWFTKRTAVAPSAPRPHSEGPRDPTVPPPEFEIVHDDGTGILFVLVMMPNPSKWRDLNDVTDRTRRRAMQNEMIDIYFEAIDGNSGVILASWGPQHPEAALKVLPSGLFAGSRSGYRREENADGFGIMRIVELRLVGQ